MKPTLFLFASSLCLLTACGGGGGSKSSSSSSLPIISSTSSSISSSSSSVIHSSESSSSSSSQSSSTCRDADATELFSCLAGTYTLRTYANAQADADYRSVSISNQGDITFTLATGIAPFSVNESLQTLDLRNDDAPRYIVEFSDSTLTLFFSVSGGLKDIEIEAGEFVTGLSLEAQQLTLNDHQFHPDAMLSNGIAGTLIEGERIKAYYRDLPDNSFFTEKHLFLKGIDGSDYWTVNLEQPTTVLKNTDYACGVSSNSNTLVELTLKGTLYSSRFGGECVVHLTSIEIIQNTNLVDYIDGELVGVLYSENRQEALRLTNTRFRMDVN